MLGIAGRDRDRLRHLPGRRPAQPGALLQDHRRLPRLRRGRAGAQRAAHRPRGRLGHLRAGHHRRPLLAGAHGAVRTALISGVLGIPRDPRQVELLGWALLPRPGARDHALAGRLAAPGPRRASRARWPARPSSWPSPRSCSSASPCRRPRCPHEAPLDGGGTATLALDGGRGTLTIARCRRHGHLGAGRSQSRPRPAEHDTVWTATPPTDDLPATLDAATLLDLHRQPAAGRPRPPAHARSLRRHAGHQRAPATVLTRDGGLVGGSADTTLVLTLNGGGLTSPRVLHRRRRRRLRRRPALHAARPRAAITAGRTDPLGPRALEVLVPRRSSSSWPPGRSSSRTVRRRPRLADRRPSARLGPRPARRVRPPLTSSTTSNRRNVHHAISSHPSRSGLLAAAGRWPPHSPAAAATTRRPRAPSGSDAERRCDHRASQRQRGRRGQRHDGQRRAAATPAPSTRTRSTAGPVTFTVTNESATGVTEVELLSDQKILGEKENLAPGLDPVSFTVTLGGGDYQIYCPGADPEMVDLTVTGEAAHRAGRRHPAGAPGRRDRVRDVRRRPGRRRWSPGAQALQAAVDSGDLAASQKAYAKAPHLLRAHRVRRRRLRPRRLRARPTTTATSTT